jgi:hypothetical protein
MTSVLKRRLQVHSNLPKDAIVVHFSLTVVKLLRGKVPTVIFCEILITRAWVFDDGALAALAKPT